LCGRHFSNSQSQTSKSGDLSHFANLAQLSMSTDDSFKEVKEAISSTLIDTTRTAGRIAGEDLAFYRSSNPEITPLLEKQNTRLLQLAQSLVRVAATGTEVSAPRLSDADSVEDSWRGIVDVIDNLLEKADACLDEYTGVIKRLSPSQDGQPSKSITPARKSLPLKNYRNQNIPKPQRLFPKVPCNDETTPFKPLLRTKPHAIVPLKNSIPLTSPQKGPQQYGTQLICF
jgi:exosome complex exonuclease RRP6